MANQSTTGFGFRAANRLGNLPSIQGQTKYQLQTAPGVALMKNDPASIQDAGNTGFIQDASFATTDDGGTGADTTTWGFQGYYSFDLADLSVGYETAETSGTDTSGYFVGLSFPEVGPGSVNIAAATTGLFADNATETLIYEASYSYPVNDGMTITPGIFIKEIDGADDQTGVAVKTSFSF